MTPSDVILARLARGAADMRDLCRLVAEELGPTEAQSRTRDAVDQLAAANRITCWDNGAISLWVDPSPKAERERTKKPKPTDDTLAKAGLRREGAKFVKA